MQRRDLLRSALLTFAAIPFLRAENFKALFPAENGLYKTFELAHHPDGFVFLNGKFLGKGTDYKIDGKTITFTVKAEPHEFLDLKRAYEEQVAKPGKCTASFKIK